MLQAPKSPLRLELGSGLVAEKSVFVYDSIDTFIHATTRASGVSFEAKD